MNHLRVPVSTYRVQFTRDFRFVDCRDLVAYLHELGIGDLYSSPRFRPRRGSSHGYDVTHPGRVNSELGTDEEFDDLCDKLKHYGMGLLLDIVPNHMAASHENPWWMDVLENGPSSIYANFFDIDWRPVTSKASFLLEDRVLLPVLGELYGNVLDNGQLTVHLDENGFFIRYYERRFPLDPGTWAPILDRCLVRVIQILGAADPAVDGLQHLKELTAAMPPRTAVDAAEAARRRDLSQSAKQRVFAIYRDYLEVRLAIDAALRELGDTKDNRASADTLDRLLSAQAYRLAHWRIAYEEINYRRFFDINDLVRLRVEDDEVFRVRHEPILNVVRQGKATGLRVDHIDGLHDPQAYLARLQTALGGSDAKQFYVVVEKILGRGEQMSPRWQTAGSTGYDFLNVLNDVFVHPGGLASMEETYAAFTGERRPFAEICYARNKQVMWQLFPGEVHALGYHLSSLAAQDRQARDIPLSELMTSLVETTACLPVYRTYLQEGSVIDEQDRNYIERTVALARGRAADNGTNSAAFDFLRRVLLVEPPVYAEDQKREWLRFVMRWQQFTGPVMAKGLEDTAFYAHHPLISRNEVGGDPLREGPPHSLAGLHEFLGNRCLQWPHSLNATSTHDTKRSEDMRARINVLSELPAEWQQSLSRWSGWNAVHRREVNGQHVPRPAEEVLIYQTLLGVWPLEPTGDNLVERLRVFLIKACREAKTYSNWLQPNEEHEGALTGFAESILTPSDTNRFLPDFLKFQKRIAFHGAFNALSQVLIKIAAPGVPDFYQGMEIWDFSLVDPDNRRPIDYAKRIKLWEELRRNETENRAKTIRQIVSGWRDGRVKLFLTDKALDFRRAHGELFVHGEYLPLEVTGSKHDHVIAFCRRLGDRWALAVAPRWTTKLTPGPRSPLGERVWLDTAILLPPGAPNSWRIVLTGTSLAGDGGGQLFLRDILGEFPVALLINREPE